MFKTKSNYKFDDLVKVMEMLRSENGCPWDIEQTHKSIRNNFIEETYEAVEAIDTDNLELLKEELGDVLLQVVFHSHISKQNGGFDIDDVADGICKKLILRHPHIFSDVIVSGADEVLNNWDDIKKLEKGQKSTTESMEAVSKALPALVRSQKVQKRAAKVGFDYPDVDVAMGDLDSEVSELKEAIQSGDKQHIIEELGDLIFSCVNIARFVGADSEEALTISCNKFINRFEEVEKLAEARDINMKEKTIDELNMLWAEAKKIREKK